MFDLRLLGPPQIASTTGVLEGRVNQRRRMAVLALLGCAPGQVLSRDKLIGYLWPECTTTTARHRLSVALHEIRRALGEGAVLSHSDDVRLDTSVVRVDVAHFETHCANARWREAVAEYRGPFLDGFFLDDAPEFEQWAMVIRDQLGRAYGVSLHRLAMECRTANDGSGEVAARRKLAAHDPYSSTAALELIRCLHELGDRSGALQHARLHSERLRLEFDTEPDAELRDYIRTLRSGASPREDRRPATGEMPTREAERAMSDPAARSTPPSQRWSRLATVAAVPLLALAVWTAWSSHAVSENAPLTRVAVMPFTVSGNEGLNYLADGMVDLLSTNMNGAGDVRTIDPHALFDALAGRETLAERVRVARDHLGANSYIAGTIYVSGRNLRVNASLYDAVTGKQIASATVDGSQTEIFSIVDAVTAQLIGDSQRRPGERPARIAAATTKSVPALKAYLAGENAFREGRFVEAIENFTRAASLDTTFAIANYRLALSMLWADVPDTLPFEPEARALRHSTSLPPHDQQLIQAFHAWRNGNARDAERLYRTIVRLYPDDSEAWLQLGETLYHYNPLLGRSPAEADHAFQRAAALDPDSWAALWHRMLIAASAKDVNTFEDLSNQLRKMEPEHAQQLELNALAAYMSGDRVAISRSRAELATATPLQLFQIAWRIATTFRDTKAAEDLVQLALQQNNSHAIIPGYLALASLSASRGDRRGVEAALTQVARAEDGPRIALLSRALFVTHPALAYSAAQVQQVLDRILELEAQSSGEALTHLHAAGVLAAHLGRVADLRAYADSFEVLMKTVDVPARHAGSLAGLRARVAVLHGRPVEALEALSGARNEVWFGWAIGSTYWSQAHDRLLRADLLRAAGRNDEALAWYESLEQFSVYDYAYAGVARSRSAAIAAKAGQQVQPER